MTKNKNEFFYEQWFTWISATPYIWLRLMGILQTGRWVHFFFRADRDLPVIAKDIHVMTVSRLTPYRLIEEQYAVDCFLKYFKYGKDRTPKNKRTKVHIGTWKLWNTDFIKELDLGRALSGYAKKRDKKIYAYLIKTSDEWIEFITYPGEPKWEVFNNKDIKTIVKKYLKEF